MSRRLTGAAAVLACAGLIAGCASHPAGVTGAGPPPMTATAQVPCAVTSEVDSGAVTGGEPVPVTLAGCDPQPATRPPQASTAQARTAAAPVSRRLTIASAPGGRTG